MCVYADDNGNLQPMTEEVKKQAMEANMIFANLGRRVLAFAY